MDAPNTSKTATLTVGNKNYDFPITSGSIGPDVVDISTLYNKAGIFTYDPGFLSTASCESKITYIDGEAGILRYRGYPVGTVLIWETQGGRLLSAFGNRGRCKRGLPHGSLPARWGAGCSVRSCARPRRPPALRP